MSSDEEYGENDVVPDELYSENKDDEDEAWVYKNLRGGKVEKFNIVTKSVKALKPRSSDAVLSCPCCFHILCMDCQRHEKYSNQYRAMFVIDIAVDWGSEWMEEGRGDEGVREKGKYYHVHCGKCSTKVAALNMDDEVYHFYDVIASHS